MSVIDNGVPDPPRRPPPPAQGSEVLARVMYATLQHHSSIQYSRSLHQLAAFVLVVLGATREEQAFWTLIGLVRGRGLTWNMERCHADVAYEHHPRGS